MAPFIGHTRRALTATAAVCLYALLSLLLHTSVRGWSPSSAATASFAFNVAQSVSRLQTSNSSPHAHAMLRGEHALHRWCTPVDRIARNNCRLAIAITQQRKTTTPLSMLLGRSKSFITSLKSSFDQKASKILAQVRKSAAASSSRFGLSARNRSYMGKLDRQSSSPRQGTSAVKLNWTNILIAMNIGVFLLTSFQPALTQQFMKSDQMITYYGQYYRLLTATFLHGNAMHLATNAFSLYNVGAQAESIFGPSRFLLVYLFSGSFANTVTYVLKSSPRALGASACIYGLIGAFGMYYWRNRSALGSIASSGIASIKQSLLINLMYSLTMANIDHSGHFGGFVGGALMSYLVGPRYVEASSQNRYSYGRGYVDRPLINIKKLFPKSLITFVSNQNNSDKTAPNFYPKQRSGFANDEDKEPYERGYYD